MIPESEQRWVNLVPLPPKVKKEVSIVEPRRESKEKSSGDVLSNRSNIFSSLENRSLLIPKNRSIEKGGRIRLPSIQRKNSSNNDSEIRVTEKSRDKSR